MPAGTPTAQRTLLTATECYAWERKGLFRGQAADVQAVYIALHPEGRYEAAIFDLLLTVHETGTWSLEGGRLRCVPTEGQDSGVDRSRYLAEWTRGQSLEWIVQETTPQDPGEGEPPRWRRDEIVSVVATAAPCEEVLRTLARVVDEHAGAK